MGRCSKCASCGAIIDCQGGETPLCDVCEIYAGEGNGTRDKATGKADNGTRHSEVRGKDTYPKGQ